MTVETHIRPRFCETDALGHINNTAVPVWFEEGRLDIFQLFNPSLRVSDWNVILRKFEIDFVAQIQPVHPVTVTSGIGAIGNSSFRVIQIARQNDAVVATGDTVMVHFDFDAQRPAPLPQRIRGILEQHPLSLDSAG